jgi:hypothetical protein
MQDEMRIRNTKHELLLYATLVAGFSKFVLFHVGIAGFCFW